MSQMMALSACRRSCLFSGLPSCMMEFRSSCTKGSLRDRKVRGSRSCSVSRGSSGLSEENECLVAGTVLQRSGRTAKTSGRRDIGVVRWDGNGRGRKISLATLIVCLHIIIALPIINTTHSNSRPLRLVDAPTKLTEFLLIFKVLRKNGVI